MTEKHFQHSRIQISSSKSELTLTASSSFTLALPAMATPPSTATDVSLLSENGEIWICKANPCRIEVVATVAETISDKVSVRDCLTSITGCPIWSELGINLRQEADQLCDTDRLLSPRVSFIVNHPDLSSQILVPPNVPCLRFQKLLCIFKLTTRTPTTAIRAPLARKRVETRYNFRDGTARNLCLHPASAYRGSGEKGENLREPVLDGEVRTLILAAMHKIFGVKRKIQGVRIKGYLMNPCLVDIAPAVWNIRYLQYLSSQTEFLNPITSSLATLVDAQSPTIRRKVRQLQDQDLDDTIRDGSTERIRVCASIQRRLWRLLQTGLFVEAVCKVRNRGKVVTEFEGREEDMTCLGTTEARSDYHESQPAFFPGRDASKPSNIKANSPRPIDAEGLHSTDEIIEHVDLSLLDCIVCPELSNEAAENNDGLSLAIFHEEDDYDYVFTVVPLEEELDTELEIGNRIIHTDDHDKLIVRGLQNQPWATLHNHWTDQAVSTSDSQSSMTLGKPGMSCEWPGRLHLRTLEEVVTRAVLTYTTECLRQSD
ncbi:hypothetical protein VTK73DRAFT_7827 [Phialemonium thermophilum]|uniref:Uncharacterized protein n=1 Tax=Phialemonium thermophilum TaxID=223376 RepID=A0ABR3XSR5_9PEZI